MGPEDGGSCCLPKKEKEKSHHREGGSGSWRSDFDWLFVTSDGSLLQEGYFSTLWH